jgi:hypothetical protein
MARQDDRKRVAAVRGPEPLEPPRGRVQAAVPARRN